MNKPLADGIVIIVDENEVERLSRSGYQLVAITTKDEFRQHPHYNNNSSQHWKEQPPYDKITIPRFVMSLKANTALADTSMALDATRKELREAKEVLVQGTNALKLAAEKSAETEKAHAAQVSFLNTKNTQLQENHDSALILLAKAMGTFDDQERAALEALARVGDPRQLVIWARELLEKRGST